jgi:uncharacterized membrane protein YeaQ/YmgE (transglycosylase-associated protein family)
MNLSGESLVVILLVGLVAGWLAGKIVTGWGFGLIGDIAIGIVGALVAAPTRYPTNSSNAVAFSHSRSGSLSACHHHCRRQ